MKKTNTVFTISIVLFIISLIYMFVHRFVLYNLAKEQFVMIYGFINMFLAIPVFFLSISFIATTLIAKYALKESLKLPSSLLCIIGAGLVFAYITLFVAVQNLSVSRELSLILPFLISNSWLFIIPGVLLALGVVTKK